MKMELNNRKRKIQDAELSCTSSTSKKKKPSSSSAECNQQLQFLYDGPQLTRQENHVLVRRVSTPFRAATPPLYVFENPTVDAQKQEGTSRSGTPTDTRRGESSIFSYENIVYMTHTSDDTTPPKSGIEPANNQVRPHPRDKQKHISQFLAAALDKELSLPDHLQSPHAYPAPSCDKNKDEHKKNYYSFRESATLPGVLGSPQQQSPRPMHTFNTYPAFSYPEQVKKHTTAMIVRNQEKNGDDDTNAKVSTPPHQSTIDKEGYDGRNRVYLHATLNFPYKEFIANNDKGHIKIWNDDEEQVRLERHFNPKWQFDFLSMFYGPEGKVDNDRTPSTNSQKDEKVGTDTTFKSIQGKQKKKTEEVILVDATNKDASNTDKADLNASSPLSLEEAAESLCDAMDVSDVTRDAIARFEDQMQINRREFFTSMIRDIQ